MLSHRAERLRGGFDHVPQGPHVSMFPQFHMAGWVSHLEAWNRGDRRRVGRPPRRRTSSSAPSSRHRAHSTYLIPAVWRRVLDADRRPYDLSLPARRRHRHLGHQPRAAARDQRGVPGTPRPRSSTAPPRRTGCWCSTTATLSRQPVLRRSSRRRGRSCASDDDRRAVGAQPAAVQRLLRRPAGAPRRPSSTAGTAPATWSSATTTASTSWWAALRDLIRTGGESVAPVEVEAALLDCPGVARRRGRRRARRRLGRGGHRLRGGRPRRHASPSAAPGRSLPTTSPGTSSPAGSSW